MAQENLTDNQENQSTQNRNHRKHNLHYQLGAPTLVYEGSRTEDRLFNGLSSTLAIDKEKDLCEAWKGHNRVKSRWQFALGVDQVESVLVQDNDVRKRKQSSRDQSGGDDDDDECGHNDDDDGDDNSNSHGFVVFDPNGCRMMDDPQQRSRLAMLLEANSDPTQHTMVLRNHVLYEYPYVPVNRKGKFLMNDGANELRISHELHSRTEEFGINSYLHSDTSLLAPFDLLGVTEALTDEAGAGFRKRLHHGNPEKLPQGNALLVVPCPCVPCSNLPKSDRSWVLFHPKGPCLERFCASNLIPPLGLRNGRHLSTAAYPQKRSLYWNAVELLPNEVDLDDTILEVGQCGEWNVQNQQCIFVVRTGTHVSVVNVQCRRPEFDKRSPGLAPTSSLFDPCVCWGCYVVTEKERIDLRSLSPRIPSFRPVSISCHPRYGNSFVPARFAFVAHSTTTNDIGSRNIIYSCTAGDGNVSIERQGQRNLRHISTIDFTSSNPICLWSAATSYVRPALAPGIMAKLMKMERGPFGLGSSLYMIDLRKSDATFQWSPSAEEMVTEGVHSISGILTDWDRDNTVWVTSTSAGKTWEIDGRMPCRSVNSWSLTSPCETSKILTVPSRGFVGDGSLLTKTQSCHTDDGRHFNSTACGLPLVKVDTDLGSSGIHLFQRPLNRPRFQTDSLECVASPGIDFNNNTSIATSSYFALPEVSDDISICGIASIRFPFSKFVETEKDKLPELREGNDHVSVLCALTMTNYGDIFSHSLLECKEGPIDDCRRHDGLPAGASAITVPNQLDDRLLFLEEGHWKPTGGMNIRLFLSNSYPKSRNAKLSSERPARDRKRVILNAAKKIKVAKNSGFVDIKTQTDKSAVTIYSRNGSSLMCHAGNQLTFPAKLLKDVRTGMRFHADDAPCSEIMQTSKKEVQKARPVRCDLSSSGIHGILNKWDGFLSSSSSSLASDEESEA